MWRNSFNNVLIIAKLNQTQLCSAASSSARSAGEFFDDVTRSMKEPVDGAVELHAHRVKFDNCHLAFPDVTIHDHWAIFRMRQNHTLLGDPRRFEHLFRWTVVDMRRDGSLERQIYDKLYRHQSVSDGDAVLFLFSEQTGPALTVIAAVEVECQK